MSGRCKDCANWGALVDHLLDSRHLQQRGWRPCAATASTDGHEPYRLSTLAIARDAEQCEAILYTAPDFGCVQFIPQED